MSGAKSIPIGTRVSWVSLLRLDGEFNRRIAGVVVEEVEGEEDIYRVEIDQDCRYRKDDGTWYERDAVSSRRMLLAYDDVAGRRFAEVMRAWQGGER